MTSAFHVLGLSVQYDLTEELIQSRYHAEVALWHPDRANTAIEKTVATQRSRALNEAYQRLLHPLHRAQEVMKAKGWEATLPGPDFLAWILDQDEPSFQRKWSELALAFHQAVLQDDREQACIVFGFMGYIYPRIQAR